MGYKLLSPLADHVFKTIFADQRNIDNLADFLTPLVGLPQEEFGRLTIVDPHTRRLFKKDKQGILDVKVITKSGKIINVEVQVCRFTAIRKRILYYLARLIGDQLRRGDKYERIQQTIIVIICDHLIPDEPMEQAPGLPGGRTIKGVGLGGKERYINVFSLMNEEGGGEIFTNLVKIVTLELPKVPEERDGTAAWPWARFFTCEGEEEYEMLAKENPEVRKVVGTLKRLSWGERRRMIAFQEEMWWRDRAAMADDARAEGLTEGWEKGRAEGWEKGQAKKQEDTVKKLQKHGMKAEEIAECLELPPETVYRYLDFPPASSRRNS